MIKLERIRTEEAIIEKMRGDGRKAKAINLLKMGYKKNFQFKSKDFDSDYWKAAKPRLEIDSNGKCAYCEAPTNAVAHGDVEHFRPKDIYWWLVYCYDNYSYSCQICNQTYKSNKFNIFATRMIIPQTLPTSIPSDADLATIAPHLYPDPLNDAEGFSRTDFLNACVAEDAGFIDPYFFDPEPFFKWEIKTIVSNGEIKDAKIKIAPRDNSVKSQNVFKEADQNLGLNREELCVLRWDVYEMLLTFKESLEDANISDNTRNRIKNMLRKMTSPQSAFTGMARYFVHEVWNIDLS